MHKDGATPVTIMQPVSEEIQADNNPLIERANEFEIACAEDQAIGMEILRNLKAGKKRVVEHYAPSKKQSHGLWRQICSDEKKLVGPIDTAIAIVTKKVSDWAEQKRLEAAAEERRLQEEARKREEEQALLEAVEAEEAGQPEEAAEILREATEAPPPAVKVVPDVAKVEGVSVRYTWYAEVTDKMALIRHVAKNPQWAKMLEPAMPALNRLAVAMKEEFKHLPGVVARKKPSSQVRL